MHLLATTALYLAVFFSYSDATVTLDSNLQVALNSQLELHCTAEPQQPSQQVMQFSWELNGMELTVPESQIVNSVNKQTLTIFDTRYEDAGTYRCTVQFSDGSSEYDERDVMVVTIPGIEAMSPVYVEVQTDAHITCFIDTTATIRWFAASDTEITSEGRYNIVNNGSTVTLVIAMVTAEDAGGYTCKASNFVGTAEMTVDLQPYVPSPPILQPLEDRVSVVKGSSFNLTCRVENLLPFPQISWTRNGGDVTAQLGDSVMVVEETDAVTLVVMATTFDPRGMYTCTAVNSLGTSTNSTEVVITGTPDVTVSPSQTSVATGESVSFSCVAFAVPSITSFQWKLSGSPLPPNSGDGSKYKVDGMTLTVNMLSTNDTGTYVCEVVNGEGTTSGEASLMVLELPPAPSNLVATSPIGQRTVTLEWTKPTGVSAKQMIDQFVIKYQLPGNTDELEAATVPLTNCSYEVTNLLPGTTHTVWVVSRNAAGDSPKSNTLSVTTVPSAPSIAMFRATSLITGRRVLLEWEIEYDGGADITNYTVEYRRGNNDSWARVNDVVDVYSGAHCVSGLLPETEYLFRLAFGNEHGNSQHMHTQATTMLGVPGQPSRPTVSSISSSSVTLSFSFTDLGSGELLGVATNSTQTSTGHVFTQYFGLAAGQRANQTVLLEVTGLLPSTVYTFKVAGVNQVGTGEFSDQTDTISTDISLYYIIAAGVGGFLLVLLLLCCIAVVVTCCRRTRHGHGAWDTKAASERPKCKSPMLREPLPSRSDLGLELSYNPSSWRINSSLSDHISPFSHDTMPREPPPYPLPPPLFESDNRYRSQSASHIPIHFHSLFELKQAPLEMDESEWYLKGCSQPDSVYPRCSDDVPDFVNFATNV